jgi:carboxymethylenebutenolidase
VPEDFYLAVPADDANGPWPGVVVLHDAFGFRGDVRGQADRFAERGYLALAPNLYAHCRGPACLLSVYRGAVTGRGAAFASIESARQNLVARPDCTGQVGMIGFCMGGGYAVVSAPRFDFAAASINYGKVPEDAADALRGSCPVVASFGRKDGYSGRAAQRLETALTSLGVAHDVREYETLGHGFLNELPRFMQSGLNPMNLVLNIHLRDETAIEDAWKRIFAFFDTHVRGAQT